MTGPRRRLPAALAVVLGLVLAGCASETERYCEELSDKKETLTGLATSGADDEDMLGGTLEVFRDLRDDAPRDIRDEWSTLVFAYEALVEAFEAAGTNPAEYDPDSPPEGVSDAEVRRIEGAAAELRTPRVTRAAEGLEQHARDVCKVNLGLSG